MEGETDDPGVNALRERMVRNAITLLMCSRGTPMFLAGDEFGNTQHWGPLSRSHPANITPT